MKKVGVKYCGGCNPSYDRVGFVTQLSNKYPDKIFVQAVEDGAQYDAIIVICGCRICCADHKTLEAKDGKTIVASDKDYIKTFEMLDKLIEISN